MVGERPTNRSVPNRTHARAGCGFGFEESVLDVGFGEGTLMMSVFPLESDVGAWDGERIGEGMKL